MKTLIENPKYRSFETDTGDVILQHSGNFFNTYWEVIVKADGTVEGDFEDKLEIVADCMEYPVEEVPANLDVRGFENDDPEAEPLDREALEDALNAYLETQAKNDKDIALM